uniref:Uncharacterized protein n=1 Tax=Arundo donax TaxID=35708 RepID=A0A0A9B7V8_ARUDO
MVRVSRAITRMMAVAATRQRSTLLRSAHSRHVTPLTEGQVKSIVMEMLESGKYGCFKGCVKAGCKHGSPHSGYKGSDGFNMRGLFKNAFRASTSLVMFGSIWAYIDKANDLTKEQIIGHILLNQLEEENGEKQREREAYLKSRQEAAMPAQRRKWLWF